MDQLKIYQIYYNEESKSKCIDHPCVIHFDNSKEDAFPFLENEVISKVIPIHEGSEYVGVWSWKFNKKINANIDDIKLDGDVISFFGKHDDAKYINSFNRHHPHGKQVMKELLAFLEVNIRKITPQTVYQNHFIAKTDIYKEYVSDWLIPAMCFLLNYDQEKLKGAMSIGKYSNYPLHPFILERLFSVFCFQNNIKITQWK